MSSQLYPEIDSSGKHTSCAWDMLASTSNCFNLLTFPVQSRGVWLMVAVATLIVLGLNGILLEVRYISSYHTAIRVPIKHTIMLSCSSFNHVSGHFTLESISTKGKYPGG